ncbi:glycoprotein [Itaqui virus]|nr:glycoprotein [Itaqui virus]
MLLLLVAFISLVGGIPLNNRCFDGGVIVEEKSMSHGIAELCIKDDISMIKTSSTQIRNTTKFSNRIMRKMLVQNYQDCNPIETSNGPIMIFQPNRELTLVPRTYACRMDCSISLDKEEATIILHSDKLNHYEVMGTTTATRWFQGSTSYSLEHTCEHIQVTCGSKTLNFHACFKYHMACIRLLNKSYMPSFMIQSVCRNKEIILMTCLILIIFALLYILTLSYICYILLPIFIPIAYLWGWLYNKSCKKCQYCGLAYHPFTKCGKNCVCGSMFENSERMKMHRTSGLCKGYKSLRAARILCKSRGSAFVLAVLLATLLLSFIQPLEAIQLKYNDSEINLPELSYELDLIFHRMEVKKYNSVNTNHNLEYYHASNHSESNFYEKIEDRILDKYLYYCPECQMTHPQSGLKHYFNGEFTNMCNSCMCGCVYNQEELNSPDGYMVPMTHKLTVGCYAPARYYTLRKITGFSGKVIIFLLTILISMSIAAAGKCDKANYYQIDEPVECSAWIKVSECNQASSLETLMAKLKIAQIDKDLIKSTKTSLLELLIKSQDSTSPIGSYVMEDLAVTLYCKEIAKMNQENGEYNHLMKTLFVGKELEVCSNGKISKACNCIVGKQNCDYNSLGEALTFYKSHVEIYKSDVVRMVQAIAKVFPGIMAKELLLASKESNYTRILTILKILEPKLVNAKAIITVVKILGKVLADTTVAAIKIPENSVKGVKPFDAEWIKKSIFDNMQTSTDRKTCTGATLYRCYYPVSLRFTFIVKCDEENKFYTSGEYMIATHYSTPDNLCVGDPFCELDFKGMDSNRKEELQTFRCTEEKMTQQSQENSRPIPKCKVVSTQSCTVGSTGNRSVAECANGYFYEYVGELHQSSKDNIGIYCFEKGCKQNRFPHHVDNLRGCTSHNSEMINRRLREINYSSLEQLKHSMQEAIKTDLVEHNYILTKNLPKVTPAFRALSIQGVETDRGIESSYIETNLLVRTGMASGLTLTTKNGDPLFDIILFVKSAHYDALYEEIYKTGPTVGINMQHNERCTGSCPQNMTKIGWLSFSKEHTSQWGCEEFGCLAINEGCVYGHCRDLIKPDISILRKAQEEEPVIKICFTLPHETLCQNINSFNAIITEKFEIQFLSNEAGKIPKLLGYKSHKILSGMINDLGTFSKMCGSVQQTIHGVFGAGIPRFDYVCHAAQRKDVTISRCFDNFYESCSLLEERQDIVFDSSTKKISLLNRNMGELRVKIKLGDINYKLFEKTPSFDLKGSCVGCINCIRGVDCELEIIASSESVCMLNSDCTFYHNNLKIDPNTQKYGLKAKCQSEKIWVELCGNKIEIQVSISKVSETIEVGNSDQTYFVKEHDMRCGTWLCKVSEQGISSIFAPFFAVFGEYGKIAFYTILGVLVAALIIFLSLPIMGKVRDMLKKNEYEYLKETLGKRR